MPDDVPDWPPYWVVVLPGALIALQFAVAVVAAAGVRVTLGGVLLLTGLADVAVVGLAVVCLCAVPRLPLARLGLRPPAQQADFIVLPLAGIALSVAGVLLADALYEALSRGQPPPPQTSVRLLSGVRDPGLRALALLVVGIVAPIAEEILFRGVVFRILWRRLNLTGGVVLSAVLFSAAHLDPAHALHLAAIGMVLAWIVSRSGSLYPGMILHALINTAGLLSSW